MKTNKSFQKRLRVTKQGKLLARRPGQNHFLARKSRSKQLKQKRLGSFTVSSKTLARFI